MYAPGENLVSGHNITLWNANAVIAGMVQPVATIPLSGPNPPNGQNQRTILIGGPGADKLLGGAGRDTLSGQKGNDNCNGGPAADVEKSC
jgi:Ca2+-binding RTX toxin-like protein